MTDRRAVRPGLSIGEIHVWTARLIDDHHATSDLLPILSQEERERAAGFAFERDRARFIQTHGIVRRIVAGYAAADAAALTFSRNRYGKPYLVRRVDGPDLQFSVSHSGHCCMLAVQREHAVGVDIEQVRDLPRTMDIVRSYFTPAECRALAALQGPAQRDAFFAFWTHKEAAVKGLGISLAGQLGRLEFERDPAGQLRLAAWDDDRCATRKWTFLRLDPEPGYIAALASEHPIALLRLQKWTCTDAN